MTYLAQRFLFVYNKYCRCKMSYFYFDFIPLYMECIWSSTAMTRFGICDTRFEWIRVQICAFLPTVGGESANLHPDSCKPRVTDPKSGNDLSRHQSHCALKAISRYLHMESWRKKLCYISSWQWMSMSGVHPYVCLSGRCHYSDDRTVNGTKERDFSLSKWAHHLHFKLHSGRVKVDLRFLEAAWVLLNYITNLNLIFSKKPHSNSRLFPFKSG